ncbi:MAG: T9SS type A sorting domain-containing protein [Brumimicrobium sp.]|nr:T9SS type A sorting domain-containing protein [Brumimicrobium sp.]
MKRILLLVMICASTGLVAQKKVTSKTIQWYSAANTLDYIDSNAYTYASFKGSITANEPEFRLEKDGLVIAWGFYEPTINYTTKENWGNSSYPLYLNQTSNKSYNAFHQCLEEETANSFKILYTYTSQGDIATVTEQYFTGSVWETYNVKTYEYDAQGRLIHRFLDEYQSGSPIQTKRDTIEYQGSSNNMIRVISYTSTNGTDFDPTDETINTWSGNTISTVDYFLDDDGDPVTPLLHYIQGQYQYSGSTLTGLDVYLVSGGVPTTMFGQFTYTYNGQGQLTVETATGFEERITTFTYDTEGFLTEKEDQVDEGAGFYVRQRERYYYQNTAGLVNDVIEASVYPVPAENLLTVKTSSVITEMVVYSMDGKKLMSQTGNDNTLDVSGLARGNYILHVFTSEGKASVKFVK